MVYVPTASAAMITESANTLGKARELSWLRMANGHDAVAVGSGRYWFRAAFGPAK